MRLEHQIELPRLSEVSTAAVWALLSALFFHELIGAQVSLASAAINHRIRESFNMRHHLIVSLTQCARRVIRGHHHYYFLAV